MPSQATAAAVPAAAQSPLFEPYSNGLLDLPNRVVMAPMTRMFSPAHVPGEDVAAYYRRRAEGGVGLILTEGTYLTHTSSGDNLRVPRVGGDAALDGWRKVVDGVHAAGGKIAVQLWHIGMRPPSRANVDPDAKLVGPSGLLGDGTKLAEPMTSAEIEAIIASYGESAANAKRLGFDGLEIHAGHGYLVDQFFWPVTNLRDDEWGRDRMRFGLEVVKACRAAVGPRFPISFRWSQWKIGHYGAKLAKDPRELEAFLQPLVDAGVDIFHCSTRRFWEPEFEGSDLTLAGWTKKLSGKTVITVGSVGLNIDHTDRVTVAEPVGIEKLEEMLARGDFDLVAVGRALLADPNWLVKVREGRQNEFVKFSYSLQDTLI
jgi:2,4-dienoyl-CoA reductase-like NADH-dependent reductase (Old Yellow Enzyme family)